MWSNHNLCFGAFWGDGEGGLFEIQDFLAGTPHAMTLLNCRGVTSVVTSDVVAC